MTVRRHARPRLAPTTYGPATLPAPPGWMADAACVDWPPDWWFPIGYRDADTRRALAICRDCPVRRPCLTWAYETRDAHAVLGGTTPAQRGCGGL